MTEKKTTKKTPTKKKKDVKETIVEPKYETNDSLYNAVRDVCISRKEEIEEDIELSKAICELANFVGKTVMEIVEPAIRTSDETVKKKDMLLVLHLAYLQLSNQIMENGKPLEMSSSIPTSGNQGTKPIDVSKDNVFMYC